MVGTGTALLVGSLAAAGATAASAAMAPDAPGSPDYVGASQAGILADADTLAFRRQVEAAAKLGGTALKRGYTKKAINGDQGVVDAQTAVNEAKTKLDSIPKEINTSNAHGVWTGSTPNPEYEAAKQAYDVAQQKLSVAQSASTGNNATAYQYYDASGNPVQAQDALYDFSGLGDADVNSANSKKTAQSLLDLQKEFGPQYIQTLKDQLALADPEGTQARKQQFDLAMQGVNEVPDTTMTKTLQQQIQDELNQGGALTPDVANEIEQNVRRGQAARGNILGNANQFQEAQEIGTQAEARRTNRQGRALSYLTSGATPEDVTFRRRQQNQANLSAFLQGTTPTTQFGQLSGSGAGVVPFVGGAPLQSNINQNAGQQGVQNAFASTTANQNAYKLNQSTPNPWTAGLSTLFTGMGAAGKLGWNPFGGSSINPSQAASAVGYGGANFG